MKVALFVLVWLVGGTAAVCLLAWIDARIGRNAVHRVNAPHLKVGGERRKCPLCGGDYFCWGGDRYYCGRCEPDEK